MNFRLIVFSGVVTAIVGLVMGVAIAQMTHRSYNPKSPARYAVLGSSMGLGIGAAQEALRQLKARAEAEQD
ncbi:MAG: hypothetical protein ACLFV6_05630 [Spirulinaceae cyanobacterium]